MLRVYFGICVQPSGLIESNPKENLKSVSRTIKWCIYKSNSCHRSPLISIWNPVSWWITRESHQHARHLPFSADRKGHQSPRLQLVKTKWDSEWSSWKIRGSRGVGGRHVGGGVGGRRNRLLQDARWRKQLPAAGCAQEATTGGGLLFQNKTSLEQWPFNQKMRIGSVPQPAVSTSSGRNCGIGLWPSDSAHSTLHSMQMRCSSDVPLNFYRILNENVPAGGWDVQRSTISVNRQICWTRDTANTKRAVYFSFCNCC